jgi:hypothetical protein
MFLVDSPNVSLWVISPLNLKYFFTNRKEDITQSLRILKSGLERLSENGTTVFVFKKRI